MALLDSLMSAIVRADGDALVMHVGERPYVVVGTQTINISTHGLNLDAMTGMLAELLSPEAQSQLEEFGAVEYKVPQQGEDRFSVVAARGGDDIWIEIRRRRPQPAPAAAPPELRAAVAEAAPAPAPIAEPIPEPVAVPTIEPIPEPAGEPVPQLRSEPRSDETIPPAVAPFEPEPAVEHAPIDEPEPVVYAAEFVHHTTIEEIEQPPSAEQIVADQPKIAALAETLSDATTVAEILERAPKIAALAETLEGASAMTSVHEVQEVQGVHASHTGGSSKPPAALEPAARVEPIERVEPVETKERLEPVQPTDQSPTAVPMTRTVRIEVPPRTQPASRAASAGTVDRLLRVAASRGASALFLTSDSRPWIRVEGDLRFLDSETVWSRSDVESAILEIAPESGQESIGRGEATEWIAEFEAVGRIRCTTFHDHRGPGVQLRMIATRAATAEQLGLSREVQALATETQGIVLVAGPRASGKSTMLSALVDLVNRQRADYVISLERQLRLVHDNRQALVSQREIRGGADDAVVAARAALRENPDVLVVDDLVSPHMVPLLLTAASEGLLVFVSITAASTAEAVERFVDFAPSEMRKAVQSSMAESFRGAVAQVLLKKSGGGLAAAREVLLATAPVTRVIEEGQLAQLPQALDSGRKHGMVSLTDALAEFVRAGAVDMREAFRKAPDRVRLLALLKREGVDTSAVERLA